MTTELDLDDVAAQSPKAQQELEQLRQQRDEFYQLLVRLKSWANDVPPEETPWDNSEEESLMEEVKRALANAGKEDKK